MLFARRPEIIEDLGNEGEQLVERMESHFLIRFNVLDLAFEAPGRNVSFWAKLNHECCFVLPWVHQECTIIEPGLVSHNPSVNFQ